MQNETLPRRARVLGKISPLIFEQETLWVSGTGYQHEIADQDDFTDHHLVKLIDWLTLNCVPLWVSAGCPGVDSGEPDEVRAAEWLRGTELMDALLRQMTLRNIA
ncbi:hypothetical protein ACFVAJ_17785 [Agromyces sp. NPDC057679]|uniref:hypothetical protein n=1 Tax=Agromyces sp. NPDC057679 TaxID=3346207 RepID=UPI00366AEB84